MLGRKERRASIRLSIHEAALEHDYTKQDITKVVFAPLGSRNDTPRDGVRTVIGLDTDDNPLAVLQRMDDGLVFHAFRMERRKHEKMLWRNPWVTNE